jgi:hypothetical protein
MALVKCRQCRTDVATDAKACPKCGALAFHPSWTKNPTANAILALVLLSGVGWCGIRACGSSSEPGTPAVTIATSTSKEANDTNADKRFEQCREKLKKAQALDMLHDLDWKPPTEPRVVAGPTFFTVPIEAKEGFAETVNCFLLAGKKEHVNFDVLNWQTGKAVGRYSFGRFKMH